MSTINKLRQIGSYLLEAPQRMIRYILGAVMRIFSPTDDQYPATGIQPFEGEPFDEKKSRHEQ